MGKQSRRKKERTPGEAKAARYLTRVGLPGHPDPGKYRRLAESDPEWFRLVNKADEAALTLLERGDAAPDQILAINQARYGLLYQDLDHALAEYASRPVMIAAAWLRWWYDHHPPATRLRDVGCGPGVLTCAYGLALPDAEVVGVDVAPEAAACAEELAGRLGARNVRFVAADAFDPAASAELGEFDQVVAVTAFGETGLYPQHLPESPDPFSLMADVDGPGLAFRSPGVENIVSRLSADGSLLVFDRTGAAAQAVRLGAAMLNAGLDVDLRQAGGEVFVEEGHPTTFTRFVGTRSSGGAPSTPGAALAAWLKAAEPPAYGEAWHDELRFEALKASGGQRLWGCEIDYSPHSPVVERREIWTDGDGSYGWIATTLGLREFLTGQAPQSLWQEYTRYAIHMKAKGLEVRFYED